MVSLFEKLKNTAKDFAAEKKWEIKADNTILTQQQLEQANPKIVQYPKHPAWIDEGVKKNSEYNDKTNTIYVHPSYDIKKDISKNIIHEKCHAYLTQIAGLTTDTFMSLQPYPTQALEQVAYTTQFYYLIKDGRTLDEIKQLGEFPDFFTRHKKILEKYFNYAKKKYDEEQLQIITKNKENTK